MYLRTTKRTNKDGSSVEYFQLAHNERDPETRKPVAKIIHNFGRVDQLDRQELVRLCQSIARVCGVQVTDLFAEKTESIPAVKTNAISNPTNNLLIAITLDTSIKFKNAALQFKVLIMAMQ